MTRLLWPLLLIPALSLATATAAAGLWGPWHGQTHFQHAWFTHTACGSPTTAEQHTSTGWQQSFQHCRMAEGRVHVVYPATPSPTVTATPRPTSTPIPQPTPQPTVVSCSGSDCATALLGLLNRDRATNGAPALTLDPTQSSGTATCVGSIGHAQAMAQSGFIWHVNAAYPQASFPTDLCERFTTAGENVGEGGGVPWTVLQELDAEMMAEPHDATTCATTDNHACNIINPRFTRVGIGIVVNAAGTWLTEDFLG